MTRKKASDESQLKDTSYKLENAEKDIKEKAKRITELEDLINKDLQPKLKNMTKTLELA